MCGWRVMKFGRLRPAAAAGAAARYIRWADSSDGRNMRETYRSSGRSSKPRSGRASAGRPCGEREKFKWRRMNADEHRFVLSVFIRVHPRLTSLRKFPAEMM